MPTLRMKIEKSGPVSFLSHLDFVEALQRALRRSSLPVAYSQGFNPHMKVSFGAALAVGVSSTGEWVDIELQKLPPISDMDEKLKPNLPASMNLLEYLLFEEKPKALSSLIEVASYEAMWNKSENLNSDIEKLRLIVKEVNSLEEDYLEIISPKRTKVMNVSKELIQMEVKESGDQILLSFWLRLIPLGSIKPTLFLKHLETKGFLSFSTAEIRRTGFWRKENGTWETIIRK